MWRTRGVALTYTCGKPTPAIFADHAAARGKGKGDQVLKKTEMEPRLYRDAMSRFAGAVHVVATDGRAGRRGVTAIAACSVSDNPPIVLVCLNRENESNDLFAANGVFALNTLASGHQPLANAFSGLTGLTQDDRFAVGHWDTIATGAPTLTDALAVFDCELIDTKDLATHRIHFGKVKGIRVGQDKKPLLYHDRGYHVL